MNRLGFLILALAMGASGQCDLAQAQLNSLILGYSGSGISTTAKEIYARLSFSMREYPIPEANGIQNALTLGHPNACKTGKLIGDGFD